MKLLLAALAVTFAIAVTASVVAIWPVVADAPWEDEPTTPVAEQDQGELLLCDAAIRLRDEMRIEDGKSPLQRDIQNRAIDALLSEAAADIDRYC